MKRTARILLICVILSSPIVSGGNLGRAEPLSGSTQFRFARWSWVTNFSRGIRGWMSYPLPQDVGFDPTLYTTRIDKSSCLVQNIKSYGQPVLHVGIIRPLSFRATDQSVFKLIGPGILRPH